MKMMTMEADMISRFKETQVIAHAMTHRPAMPTWLPAPPVARTEPAKARQARQKTLHSIWIESEGDSLGEKLMLTALVFAAAVGIGYAFIGLLNLVSNWGAFNSWVSRIIQ